MTIPAPNRALDKYLRKVDSDLTETGLVDRIELWHTTAGELGERIATVRLADRPEGEGADELVFELWTEAYNHAGSLPQSSMQRYVVRAFRTEADLQEESSCAFVLPGMAVSALTGASTEPPTPKGLLSQEMRQNDSLHAMVIQFAQASAGTLAQQLESERKKNAMLMDQATEQMRLTQDLLDRKHERDLATASEEKKNERLDALLQMGMTLLPVIATKLLSSPQHSADASAQPPHQRGPAPSLPPEVATIIARDQAVGQLLSTLTAEQVQAFMGSLTTEQNIALGELYSSFTSSPSNHSGSAPSTERSGDDGHQESQEVN